VFSLGSVPRLYHKDQRDKPAILELTAEVGGRQLEANCFSLGAAAERCQTASQWGQEPLDTEAEDAMLLEAATKQCDWGY
jgi:hypothetical protein